MTEPTKTWSKLSLEAKRRLLAEKLRERADRPYAEQALSHGQRALWFVHQFAPQSPAYNVIFAAKILSPVDVRALEAAFQGLVDRHASLRASFPVKNGEPIARVEKELLVPFQVVDASTWSDDELVAAARRESERPFDLLDPPLRVGFFHAEPHPVIVATFHHIAMDGWSLWVCLSELSELYASSAAGRAPRLPEPQCDFADFLRWQDELLTSSEGERQRAYWLEELGGELPLLNLPTDKARPRMQRFRGASQRFAIGDFVSRELRSFSQSEGTTIQMGLFTLFQILLFRHTHQPEFPIGTLSSGRTRQELEEVVGYLANPLVLRTRLDTDTTFRSALKRTREKMLDAFDRQDYPFPLLVDALAPERDPSRSSLFQVLFVFEKAQRLANEGASAFIVGESGACMELGDLALSPLPFTAQHEGQFDLILLMAELDGKLAGYFDYSEDLFERSTIARLTARFETLAASAVRSPDELVSKLALLGEEERRALTEWNETDVDYPPACLHELFAAHVLRDPHAIAAVFEEETLTYQALNERANTLAHYLLELGISPEIPVAVCVHRSLDIVIGMLGIMKAGGAYLPIDPAYPIERRLYMLDDSDAPVLLTHNSLRDDFAEYGGRIVCLDGDGDELATRATTNPQTEVAASDLAYVIYTSGSTGRPKGVLVEHRGMSTLSREQQRLFGVGPGSRVLQFSSISFDASIFEMVMALGSGASLYLGRRESLLPGRALLEKLRSERIQIVTLPPSALMNVPVAELPDLRTITVAGEACPGELVERWVHGRRFFNLYGPTEATIWSTFAECTTSASPPPIGTPIANTQVYILDANGEEVPLGVTGELCIGGVALARGYLNLPKLTAEKFVTRPIPGREDQRLYRTGDLARRREDGNIEFLGRLDFQVKVRGFRIELAEIESVLGSHPDVNEVCVVVRADGGGDERLVGYVVPHGSRPIPPGELRNHAKQKLPEFMVPAAFVSLDAFPMTPSGKIDRSGLPAPESQPRVHEAVVAPKGELEKRIASVWRELLKIDDVGVDDNFFEIGGNSLLITRANAKLEDLLGRSVPIVDMFRFPTIRELALRLGNDLVADERGEHDRSEGLVSGRERLQRQRRRRTRTTSDRAGD